MNELNDSLLNIIFDIFDILDFIGKFLFEMFGYVLCILMFYGFVCECLYSCLIMEEGVCLFIVMGVEVCIFNFFGFFLLDDVLDIYLKVVELCELV